MEKKKILVISDHALSYSGVGIQTKYLIEGLIKTNKYRFIQLGAAISHENYKISKVNDDFYIIPINGFGDKNLLRNFLIREKPDAVIIFTDPRFFKYLFEMENEIHQLCPILWWHVWDNGPYPDFNDYIYESVDSINCHSYFTYNLIKQRHKEKVSYIPHSIPEDVFYKIEKEQAYKKRKEITGKAKSDFICLWANRNCKRKRPGDVLKSWQMFLFKLEENKEKNNAYLIMHTDPYDSEGYNLIEIAKKLKLEESVLFSRNSLNFKEMNDLYNISDVTLNISSAEGFGLSTLESMQTGTPIIATKTGGLTRQVINHETLEVNGIALEPDVKTLLGSQETFFIYEDIVKNEKIAKAIYDAYKWNEKTKELLSNNCISYVKKEFNYKKTIELWENSLEKTIQNWKKTYNRIRLEVF